MDFLHELIQTMDAGDKRHFRKRARRNGFRDGENYLELFDLMEKAESYNEDAICRQLSNPVFARNISAGRHYLYYQVLDSLQEQHTGARDRVRPEMEAARYWSRLQVLLDKGLTDQVKKLAQKARRYCARYHLIGFQMQFLIVERNMVTRFGKKGAAEELDALIRQYEELQEHFNMESKLISLYERFYLAHRSQRRAQSLEAYQQFERFFEEHAAYMEERASFTALVYSHFIRGFQRQWENNFEGGKHEFGQLLALYDSDEKVREANLERYLHIINNYLVNFQPTLTLENEREYFQVADRMEQIQTPDLRSQLTIRQYALYFKLTGYLTLNKTQTALELEEPIRTLLDQHSRKLTTDRVITFQYQMGGAHFMAARENPDKKIWHLNHAVDWFNQVENLSGFDAKVFLRSLTRVYLILSYFDLGSEELVGYRLRSYMHSLRKAKRTKSFEYLLYAGLRKVIAVPPGGREKPFRDLFEKLGAFPIAKDLQNWVEEKLKEIGA